MGVARVNHGYELVRMPSECYKTSRAGTSAVIPRTLAPSDQPRERRDEVERVSKAYGIWDPSVISSAPSPSTHASQLALFQRKADKVSKPLKPPS